MIDYSIEGFVGILQENDLIRHFTGRIFMSMVLKHIVIVRALIS